MATREKDPFDSDEQKHSDSDGAPKQTFEPEIDNPEMFMKPACECQNCVHWTQSADWTTPDLEFEGHHKRVCKERKIQPLLRSARHPGKTPKIFTFNPGTLTKIEKQSYLKTLVHGEVIPQPVKLLTDTYFSDEIQAALGRLNYKYSLPIQSFVWPAIFRQLNVVMVGGPKSGKTMSYLPALCTFSTAEEEKYRQLSKYKGPLVVIICPNSKHCEDVYDLMKKLFENSATKPKIALMTYPVHHINSVDIVITIPSTLTHCLKSRTFNLKRMCHLVLEDASCLLKNNHEEIYKILEVTDEMLEHRMCSTKVQFIVASTKWTSDLQKLLKSIYVTPLVCIGNYLEAALYGNIQFEVKFLVSQNKKHYIEGLLRDKSHLFKTIVVCHNNEISDLNKWLVRNGIEVMALNDDSTKEQIEVCEEEWAFMRGGQYKVLLCTDFIFDSLLCITDAMWLVSYSFSATWTRFIKRFSALSSHYKSPWETNEEEVKPKCFLMIDENCEQQMTKVLNLLNRLSKDLPPSYQKYASAFKSKTENEKIDNGIEICNTLKLFGKCGDSLCEKRHFVCEQLDVSENLPKSGKLVFKILNIKDVTQFSVQVIRHIDLEGKVKEINDDDLRKPLTVSEKRAKNIKVGKFYAHCDYTPEGDVFMLCHVLSIPNDNFVEVKFANELVLQTLQRKLYELPPNLEIVDVIMCNLIPPFKDEMFSARSFHVTHNSLQTVEYKNMILTGDIYLQLDRTFWLNNIAQVLQVDGCDIIKFNLTKHLTNLKVVELSSNQITSLHKLCEKCGITLPCYLKHTAKKASKAKEVEAQRAFLDDNVHEVILSSAVSPEEFYVRLAKFQPLLENLERDIQESISKGIPEKHLNIEIGKYYLALDSHYELYSRVLILNIQDSKALCFYVDYGDEAIVELSKLKMLPSKFLIRLPFQAIQCRLYGLSPISGEWDDEATDVLYKYMFEPQSDVFRSIYVQTLCKDASETMRVKTTYSVLMKDGFGDNNVLINQLMLDCGFATSIFDKIDDFEIPRPEAVEEESSDSDAGCLEVGPEEPNLEEIFGDDFDLEIIDAEEFLEVLGVARRENPSLALENSDSNHTETIHDPINSQIDQTVEKSNCLTPDVYWSQTENTVKLKIKLIGVENYKTNVVQKRIFTFSSLLNEKNYELKFTLHKPVKMANHRALGQEVVVVLNKLEPVEWLQLTGTQRRMRFVHYEVPEFKEEAKRKLLQLDITDDESDENDGEAPMYHVISDMDSEFDEEIDSSESDL
ncbi:putative ATP-dependent RNA helicase TDRD12 [Tribolium castaneum]|uniref:RNA helicase n=1 Tax=Tribolium castaneum TaxID=7070 RepID=A0A139WLL2_TRICA|nr:PREDICTED: putative ATP-dependent RNA helicase TDRD12 [Tribolium castaneum]KYB28783.1 Putative ATP-dependent RNA helicase TDRD12-like Protein [Tribolium castaneum]|eukprot:XP_008199553.1 PREDICTED: putative ATP-dependent RNA helicase TDRD12 [Tribolium castaneum]